MAISFLMKGSCAYLLGGLVLIGGLSRISGAEDIPASAKNPAPQVPHQAHWDYMGIDGPEHWGMLDPGYMVCEKRREQSPIDVKAWTLHATPTSYLIRLRFLHAYPDAFRK